MAEPSIFTRATDNNDKAQAGPSAVDKFLEKATGRSQGVGRIVFAIDATASRGPTWDMARGLTGDMIREATSVGRLELQLVFFRGGSDSREECVASDWISDPTRFAQIIAKVECRAGYTQITRALAHGRRETTKDKVNAMVLIGDACEPVEDTMDSVSVEAAELGFDAGHHTSHRFEIGDIGLIGFGLAAGLLDLRNHGLGFVFRRMIVHRDRGTRVGQRL